MLSCEGLKLEIIKNNHPGILKIHRNIRTICFLEIGNRPESSTFSQEYTEYAVEEGVNDRCTLS